MNFYCLYSFLSGDSRGFIYIFKVVLYIDKEGVRDRIL